MVIVKTDFLSIEIVHQPEVMAVLCKAVDIVTMSYNGKAPFMAVTIIKPSDVKASAVLDGRDVVIDAPSGKWIVSREGVKRV